ncbi:Spindle pole body component alp14 AltName: Full=Altered polarity protein 14 [Serendipita indica DSM 11827]|nr:Spindle pole body component alp14 AltName: Full=Altered polarity protein 14 [Serendipita indica DSM 11827]
MDGAPPPEEDFSALPISERLAHKNWKARVSAYEALVKTFGATPSETDPAFKPYTSNPELLKKMVTDANAVAQEKGVEAVIAFVKFAGETSAKTREAVVPALVDKCLGSTRQGTKTKAIDLILEYVEVENGAAAVVEDVLPGLNAKQPKTVAGAVTALKEIVRLYGPVVCPPKSVFKALPKIFGHTDKAVRAEGSLLVQSLYSYVGDAIQPAIAELKPVQIKEINEACEALKAEGKGPGSFKPERFTRAAAREREAMDASAVEEEAAPPAEIDPTEFMEETDVVKKFPEGLYTNLASSKWKDRKTALDDLAAVLTPMQKIKDSPPEFAELTKALAGRMSDANIMCVMAAASCVEGLAKGLGTPFGRYREIIVTPMLDRLKERKQNVTDSLGQALDAVFATVTFPDIVPDILPQLASKNPQVKEGAVKFLHRCMLSTKTPPAPAQVKSISEAVATLLSDGAEPVRNEAAETLGVFMKIVGERAMNPVLEPLDDIKKNKVKEAFDKAVVKCKVGGTAPAPRAAAPPKAEPPKKKAVPTKPKSEEEPPSEDGPPPTPAKLPPKLAAKLAASKKPAGDAGGGGASAPAAPATAAPAVKKPAAVAAPAKASAKAGPPPATDTFKFRFTPEDAEERISDLIPANIRTDFGDANWKTRLAALDEMTAWLEGGVVDSVESELVVRFLAKKGWSEKNFQVSAKLYGVLCLLAERASTFGKASAALAIPHLTEKLGDLKLKKPAGDALMLFAEKTSLSFVFSQAYDPLSKQKAPKVIADATTWMKDALIEFGIAGLSLRSLIDYLKNALTNSNAAVRSSATNTLVTLKLFAGAAIKDFLDGVNPQLMATIEKEFEKVEGQEAPVPTRTQADVSPVTSSGGSASKGADPMEELYPRVDIDRLLVGTTILADSKSDAWKSRKEALEKLQGLLEANKRFKPNLGDIGQVLKARVLDQNKAVQALALDIIARIATGMNKPFEKYTRIFVVSVAAVLADQKAPIRGSAMATLTAMATACESIDSLLHGLATALEVQNPLQRSNLLGWMVDWFKEHPPTTPNSLSELSAPTVLCLDDRSADVRKSAQALLPYLIQNVGYDAIVKETNPLKPASRSAILPILQALKPSGSTATTTQAVTEPKPTAEAASASAPKPKATGVSRPIAKAPSNPASSRPESRAESEIEAPTAAKVPLKSKLTALKRPGTVVAPAAKAAPRTSMSGATPAPFMNSNPESKKGRLAKDANRWVIESGPVRKDLADFLQAQMDNSTSKDVTGLLFSQEHNAVNDWVSGMTIISDCYANTLAGDERYGPTNEDMKAILIANSDLALKYACLRVHENQSNVVGKALDVVETVQALLAASDYRLTDAEAACFLPTFVHKLGDAREPVRVRVQQIIQKLPKIYSYSRIFQTLLEHGLRSKNAKTRQGALDELGHVLRSAGLSACEPSKAFPVVASMIGDKDAAVRKSALSVLSEAYILEGERIWSHVGTLSLKDKGQLEERLRRVPGAKTPASPAPQASATHAAGSRLSMVSQRAESPALTSRLSRPMSPAVSVNGRASPVSVSGRMTPTTPTTSSNRPKRDEGAPSQPHLDPARCPNEQSLLSKFLPSQAINGHGAQLPDLNATDDISLIISNILSNDPSRSVDALKKVQKILEISPEAGKNDARYRELADHTEGLIETITSQILRGLLEELTLRLLITDESTETKVKDLSKFINMILLRLFATGRRITIFRALFLLLLQIVKPFAMNGTTTEDRPAKVAELVLKCIWKLARNIPEDLKNHVLDPVELFPAIEQFLQSIPPNDWRARATNKIPSGDMPLRTVKVIIQHVVAEFREDVYDYLSQAFDDPSATIVYPYVYRILNARPKDEGQPQAEARPPSPTQSARSSTFSRARQDSIASRASTHNTYEPSEASTKASQHNDADLDEQLNAIWLKTSVENGAMHNDAITELWNFIKAHPEKKPRVDAMIDSTGGVYTRYIRRALARRQAEDDLSSATPRVSGRPNSEDMSQPPSSPVRTPGSPRRSLATDEESVARMRHFHDMFNYNGRTSIVSNGSSRGSIYEGQGLNHPGVQAHLESLRRRDSMAFNNS